MRTWDDSKSQGYGLLAGIVSVVVQVAAFAVAGQAPARDASASKIAEYVADHEGGLRAGGVLFAVGLMFALVFFGSLWRVVSKLEANGPRLAFVAVAAAVISGAFASVGQILIVGAALRADTLGATVELAWSMGHVAVAFALAMVALNMASLALLTLRSGFLPTWTGWLAGLAAVAAAVGVIGIGSTAAAFAAIGTVGFLLWLVWTAAASIILFRRNA